MIIETFPVGLLQCNCTILGDEQTREAIVIDPGDDPQEILTRLAKYGLSAKQLVCTHTHIDHVGAIADLQQRLGVPAAIHKADLFLFEKLDVQAQWTGIPLLADEGAKREPDRAKRQEWMRRAKRGAEGVARSASPSGRSLD